MYHLYNFINKDTYIHRIANVLETGGVAGGGYARRRGDAVGHRTCRFAGSLLSPAAQHLSQDLPEPLTQQEIDDKVGGGVDLQKCHTHGVRMQPELHPEGPDEYGGRLAEDEDHHDDDEGEGGSSLVLGRAAGGHLAVLLAGPSQVVNDLDVEGHEDDRGHGETDHYVVGEERVVEGVQLQHPQVHQREDGRLCRAEQHHEPKSTPDPC